MHRHRVRLGACLLLAAFTGCTSGVVRPTTPVRFAYGGRPGDARTWKLEQVLRGEFAFGGMPQLLVITLRGTLHERIEEVTPEGWRRVTQRWVFDPVEFNGMAVPLEGIPRELEVHSMRGPIGQLQPMEAHADAAGDLLAWAARWIGGLFPPLPDHPVPAGGTWAADETLPAAAAGEFHLVGKGTFEDLQGGVARLTTESEITLTRSAGGAAIRPEGPAAPDGSRDIARSSRTPSGMEAFHLQNAGEVRFDLATGRVRESRQSGSLQFKGRTGKSPLTIRARFTSAFTELP